MKQRPPEAAHASPQESERRQRCPSPGGVANLVMMGRDLRLADPEPYDSFGEPTRLLLRRVDRDPVAFSPSGRLIYQQLGAGPERETRIHDLAYPYEPQHQLRPALPSVVITLTDWLDRQSRDLFAEAGVDRPADEFELAPPERDRIRHLSQSERMAFLEALLAQEPSVDRFRDIIEALRIWPTSEVQEGLTLARRELSRWPGVALVPLPRMARDMPDAVSTLLYQIKRK